MIRKSDYPTIARKNERHKNRNNPYSMIACTTRLFDINVKCFEIMSIIRSEFELLAWIRGYECEMGDRAFPLRPKCFQYSVLQIHDFSMVKDVCLFVSE